MRLEVRFRHMERSEALEDLATQKVSAAVEGFNQRHSTHVQVWLVSELNRTASRLPSFVCEIEVRYPHKKDLFVSRESADMRSAIMEACDSLEMLLTEAGKKELEHRSGNAIIANLAVDYQAQPADESYAN